MAYQKVKLNNYQFVNDHILLNCTLIDSMEKKIFLMLINDGCILTKIKTFNGKQVSMNYLEEGDILHIKTKDIKEKKYLEIYPKIKLAKNIKINSKYTIESESSDDEIFEFI
jgi:hypothetical protein